MSQLLFPNHTRTSLSCKLLKLCRNNRKLLSFYKKPDKLGLFGLHERLYEPNDLLRSANRATERINEIRNYLRNHSDSISYSVRLIYLDSISNELCCIMDVAECCRNVHMDPEFIAKSESVFSQLSKLILELNSDKQLYSILNDIVTVENKSKLTDEEYYFAFDLLRDFKMEGIHLDDNEKKHLQNLQGRVVESETLFNQNIVNDKNYCISIPLNIEDKQNYQHLRNWLGNYIPQPSTSSKSMILHCTPDRRFLAPIMNSLHSNQSRKSIWFETFVQPIANFSSFSSLVQNRHKLANYLDYPNFLSKGIIKNVANQPEQIKELLQSLSETTKSIADEEVKKLRSFKSQLNSSIFSSIFPTAMSSKTISDLNPWDIGYLQSNYSSQNNSGTAFYHEQEDAYQKVKAYLSLSVCMDGIILLTKQLFNLEMEEVDEIGKSEMWVSAEEQTTVRKFQIFETIGNSQKLLGVVFFDCVQRANKFPGAAHFTVRCGCDKITWESDFQPKEFFLNKAKINDHSVSTENQTPIVVLTFSFHRSSQTTRTQEDLSGKYYSQSSVENDICLSLQDLETLYHEWGHALHSIFSRTKFQHLSGTRGGSDYIEVSQFL